MADVQLPDGNVASIPDFAMETTQQQMLKALGALVGADEKALKLLQEMEKATDSAADRAATTGKAAQEIMKDQVKATEAVGAAVQENQGKIFQALDKADGFLTKSFLSLGSIAVAAGGALATSINNIGNELLELQQLGVGFTDASGSAETLVADLNFLGLSSKEAGNLMRGSAGVIQTLGKSGFSEIQKTFSQLSDNGSKFGLSLSDTAEILSEDLATRQQLGFLARIDQQNQAKRSMELYESQMKASQLLGKSIDEIRGAGEEFIATNADVQLGLMEVAANLGPEAAAKLTAQTEKLAGDLAAMGIDPQAANQIMKEMFNVQAFLGEGGKELYKTLTTVGGTQGKAVAETIQEIQQGLRSGDPKKVAAAQAQMEAMPELLGNFAQSMRNNPEQLANMRVMLEKLGPMGEAFAKSLGPAATAADNFGKVGEMSGLAKGAQAFTASMSSLSGSMSGAMTDITSAFSSPVGAFADALTKSGKVLDGRMITEKAFAELSEEEKARVEETSSVMQVFKDAIETVRKTVFASFGDMGDGAADLAQSMRDYLIPKVQEFAAWFAGGGWESIKSAFVTMGEIINGVTLPFRGLFNLLTGDVSGAAENLKDSFSSVPTAIGTVVGSLMLFNKALKAGGAVKSLFGGGASAAATSTGGGSGGGGLASVGKGIGDFGKGIGKGIQGIFTGLAKGLEAFGNPAILKGAGILAGAIVIIGGAIAAAAWLTGKALPTLAEGLGSLSEIDAMGIFKLGGAMVALGAGLTAMTGGALVAGIASFFGSGSIISEDTVKALQDFSKHNINVSRVQSNADAVVAYSKAMAALGASQAVQGLGNIVAGVGKGIADFFGVEPPLKKMVEFSKMQIDAERIAENSRAVAAYGEAMSTLQGAQPGVFGAISQGLARAIGGFFEVEPPLAKLKRFGEMDIPGEKIKTNAEAVVAFAGAMAKLNDSDTGMFDALGNYYKQLFDGMTVAFGGDSVDKFPVEQINAFAALSFSDPEAIIKNAEIVSSFSEALSGLGAVEDLDDVADVLEPEFWEALNGINTLNFAGIDSEALMSVGNGIERIASAYAALAEIDADDLMDVSKSIAKTNEALKNTPPAVMQVVQTEVIATGATEGATPATAATATATAATGTAEGATGGATGGDGTIDLSATLAALAGSAKRTNSLLADIKKTFENNL